MNYYNNNQNIGVPGVWSAPVRGALYEQIQKRKHRKVTNHEIVQAKDGRLFFCEYFNSGEKEMHNFSNMVAPIMVSQVQFDEYDETDWIIIESQTEAKEPITVALRKKQLYKEDDLLKRFEKQKCLFNNTIKHKQIGYALRNYILQKLEEERREIYICVRQGWKNNFRFFYKEEAERLFGTIFPDCKFPVYSKSFKYGELEKMLIDSLLNEFAQVQDSTKRFCIMMYPFVGIMNSILNKEFGYQGFLLNFIGVPYEMTDIVSSWFQIFNREQFVTYDGAKSEKEIRQILESAKDEVIVFDVRGYDGETPYQQKKKKELLAGIAHKVQKGNIDGVKRLDSSVVILSDEILFNGAAVNFFWDDSVNIDAKLHENFLRNKCMEAVLSRFVDFVEHEYSHKITDCLQKYKSQIDDRTRHMRAVCEILGWLFEQNGISLSDFYKELDMERLQDLFDNTAEDKESMKEAFLRAVRNMMPQHMVCRKTYSTIYHKGVIYFDDTYIYFPYDMFRNFLKTAGMNGTLNTMLVYFLGQTVRVGDKDLPVLLTDSTGSFVKKIQVGGVRKDYCAINRKFLSPVGCIEIVNLAGKEICADD